MYLGSPLLPMNVSLQKATQDLKELLAKKFWNEVEVTHEMLILVPYFLFNYHYYVEKEEEGTQKIKKAVDGVLAIDGHSIKVEENMTDLIKYSWKKAQQNIPKMEFDEKWNNIDKKEQYEIVKLKTAEYFDVPKQNVIITSIRKVLVPFYSFKIVCDEEEYRVKMNVIDGTFYGMEEVPAREKGALELTKETLLDLKKPSKWVSYSKEMVSGAASAGKKAVRGGSEKISKKDSSQGQGIDISFFARPEILVIIMLLALLLIYLALFV